MVVQFMEMTTLPLLLVVLEQQVKVLLVEQEKWEVPHIQQILGQVVEEHHKWVLILIKIMRLWVMVEMDLHLQ